MTIKEARAILDMNNKIADENNQKVVTVFHKAMMIEDTVYTTMFSDSSYEALDWADKKAESLKKLGVPFIIYNAYHLRESFGSIDFDKTKE